MVTTKRPRQRSLGPWDPRSPAPRRRHGLSPTDVNDLLSRQGFACAICGTQDPGDVSWNIDHDHRHCAGMFGCAQCVRGLLCRNCNHLLGNAKDNPDSLRSAIEYLARFEAVKRW